MLTSELPQAAPRVEDPHALRQPRLPPGGWLPPGPTLPHLPLPLPPTQGAVPGPLPLRQHLDRVHPRWGLPRAPPPPGGGERLRPPH